MCSCEQFSQVVIHFVVFLSLQFLEQMTEMVQKGIEAAQQNLVKDAEDQLLEEVSY